MNVKKIELKVAINCYECKTQVMKAVAKLHGVNQVTVDAEKGIVTVIGELDPVRLTEQVRKKTGKHVDLKSVGPPTPPAPAPTPDPNPAAAVLPPSCPQCSVYISYESYERCTIL